MRKVLLNTLLVLCGSVFLYFLAVHFEGSEPLRDFKAKLQRQTLPAKDKSTAASLLEVTSSSYELPPYLSDFTLAPGETYSLNSLIPANVTVVDGMLKDSAYQFRLEGAKGKRPLTVKLSAGSGRAGLKAVLFDSLLRPVGAWRSQVEEKVGATINESLDLLPGVYRLVISNSGILGRDFSFIVKSDREANASHIDAKGDVTTEKIPTLEMELSKSSLHGWNFMLEVARKKLAEAGGSGQAARGLPGKSVTASIRHEDGRASIVSLSLSGAGYGGHFREDAPSFTVKVNSGPLYMGMTRFKLYSVKVKEGLLDYVAGSILRDEGLFVPRWLLVHVTVNGESKGVYVLEETPSPEFFAGVRRYDGRIHARSVTTGLNKDYYKPPVPEGFPEHDKWPRDFDYTPWFERRIDALKLAKAGSFITRFHATHATQKSDFRFYQHPFLYEFEPIIRDMNVDLLPARGRGYRAFLTHTSWWYGKRPIGGGPHYNPRIYPGAEADKPYTYVNETLNFGNVHPSINSFVRTRKGRELFESYLFYALDPAVRGRYLRRLEETLSASSKALGMDIAWIRNQVIAIKDDEFEVGKYFPGLKGKSRILVYGGGNSDGRATFVVYNMSPFSARLKLPHYAKFETKASPQAPSASSLYLAPSDLFPLVVTGEELLDTPSTPPAVTRRAAAEILELERLRYGEGGLGKGEEQRPFVSFSVPLSKRKELFKYLSLLSQGAWANGNVVMGAESFIEVEKMPATAQAPAPVPEPLAAIEDILSGAAGAKTIPAKSEWALKRDAFLFDRSSYLDAGLSLENLSAFSMATWVKVMTRPESGKLAVVMDTSHDAVKNAVLQIDSKAGEGLVNLTWFAGGGAVSVPLEVGRWHHVVVTGVRESKKMALYLDGRLVASVTAPNALWGEGSEVMLGRLSSSRSRFFEGALSGTDFYDSALTSSEVASLYLGVIRGTRFDGGLAVMPVDVRAKEGGFLFSYIFANHSENETEVDIRLLRQSVRGGAPMKVRSVRGRVIGGDGSWKGDKLLLGGASLSGTVPSKLWVGVLQGLVSAPFSSGPSPIAYVEIEVESDNASSVSFKNVPNLAAGFLTGRKAGGERSVVVYEPFVNYLPPRTDKIAPLIGDIYLEEKEGELSPLLTELGPGGDGNTRVGFRPGMEPISGAVIIPKGYTLELEAGRMLRFEEGAGLIVYGRLEAVGSPEAPVSLLPSIENGTWSGLLITGGNGRSIMERVVMKNAAGGRLGPHILSGGFSVFSTDIVIKDAIFNGFLSNDGLHFSRSWYTMDGVTLSATKDDGLDTDWAVATIRKSSFYTTGGDAVDFSGSNVTLTSNSYERAADKGVSAGEGSVLNVDFGAFIDNRIGLAVKDQSIVMLDRSKLSGNEKGVAVYIKKPMYAYPSFSHKRSSFMENGTDIVKHPKKRWTNEFD